MSILDRTFRQSVRGGGPHGLDMREAMTLLRPLPADETDMTASGPYACHVATSAGDIARLREDWHWLACHAGADTQGFQTPAWGEAWTDVFADAEGEQRRPFIITVRDAGGEPVVVWPLMRVRYPFQLTVITWLSDPYGQYGDVITSLRGRDLERALDPALRAIAREGADLVRLKFVREDAAIAPFLRARFRHTGESYGAPWLDLTPYATPDELEKRYSRTQRRRRRKIENRLLRHFGAQPVFRRLVSPEEIRAALPSLLEHKRRWLRGKGLVSRALFHDGALDFLLRLAERMAAEPQEPEFVLTTMEVGGRQLSWEMGFRWKGRHYAYLTAQIPEARSFSIGRLHMYHSQRLAVEDGMRAFDLLVPAAEHKRSWSSGVAPVRNHFLPLTLRGRLLGQGYLCHLRPMMREVYHRLPAGMRSFLHLSDIHEQEDGRR